MGCLLHKIYNNIFLFVGLTTLGPLTNFVKCPNVLANNFNLQKESFSVFVTGDVYQFIGQCLIPLHPWNNITLWYQNWTEISECLKLFILKACKSVFQRRWHIKKLLAELFWLTSYFLLIWPHSEQFDQTSFRRIFY